MPKDIRFAGLDDRLRRQLMQTQELVQHSSENISTQRWNDTACDLLIADTRHRHGQNAIAKAEQLGVPILVVSDYPARERYFAIRPDAAAAKLTHYVYTTLVNIGRAAEA